MKALIYYGPKDIRMEERPQPIANENEAVIKLMRAGICGSDLTAYLYDGHGVGILPKGEYGHDGQFGHEMAGTVYSVGDKVKDVKAGDRVFINPTTCKRNGMLGCDIAGAFSEYVVVEDAEYNNNLFQLEEDVSFDEAVVIEPLSVGTHGKNCIDVKPHEHVVVYGAGTIGLCALNALLAAGCSDVVVIDVNEERLMLAKKMGAATFNPAKAGDTKEFLIEHFGARLNPFGFSNADVDAFLDCAGGSTIPGEVINCAKNGARLAVVAVHKRPTEFNMADFMAKELLVKGSCGYNKEDIIEAFNHINLHKTKVAEIVTHHFPHERAVEALQFAADPKSGAVKVVIDYEA